MKREDPIVRLLKSERDRINAALDALTGVKQSVPAWWTDERKLRLAIRRRAATRRAAKRG